MSRPLTARQALEQERDGLLRQLASYWHELEHAPVVRKARREDLEWRIRRNQKRLAEVEARLSTGWSRHSKQSTPWSSLYGRSARPWAILRGPMDPASQRIRDKVWYGILPNLTPVKIWDASGTGHKLCDGCDATITPKEIERGVELGDGRTLRFHAACASLWQVLRMALPEDR
jgi:hypothetical protein